MKPNCWMVRRDTFCAGLVFRDLPILIHRHFHMTGATVPKRSWDLPVIEYRVGNKLDLDRGIEL